NDLFGHPVGDSVLSKLAAALRQNGEAFRLGGDEFALLLPGSTEADAVETAATIIERIAEVRVDHVGSVTVSAGVATFPRQARTAPRASVRLRAWPRRSISETRTRVATPRAWPSSPRGSPPASGSTRSRSSS